MNRYLVTAFALFCAPSSHASPAYTMDEFRVDANQAPAIENVIEKLPPHVLHNLTFKRGTNIEKRVVGNLGPHGHMAGPDSASSTPAQPRVFVWDQLTGFTASWNSGNPKHTAAARIDLYDFDFKNKKHRLLAWNPTQGFLPATEIDPVSGDSCLKCHGPQERPIFPMYPDWPQFYGEFNDEMAGYPAGAKALRSDLRQMANDFQPKDAGLYAAFQMGEGRTNPRYTPLYRVRPNDGNAFYPFRPRNTTSPFSDVSRAFFYRPNLRLGVMYNRLTALQVFERIKHSPMFREYPDVIFYALLDCNWDFSYGKSEKERAEILDQIVNSARQMPGLETLNLRGTQFSPSQVAGREKEFYRGNVDGQDVYFAEKPYTDRFYSQIPYEDLLRLLGLEIRDLDIRFKYDSGLKVSAGYNVYDPKAFYATDSVMDIGYVRSKYRLNPICDNDNTPCVFTYDKEYMQGMRYFNSYFDGAATMNELLAAQMLIYLTDKTQDFSQEPALEAVRTFLASRIPDPNVYFETLNKKYARFTDRLKLDGEFFSQMDQIGPWLQLPFNPMLLNVHNREEFWGERDKQKAIRLRHAQWLNFEDRVKGRKNLNGGNNICWNVYDSMQRLRRKDP